MRIFETPQALGQELAAEILAGINKAKAAGKPYLLGCPGGRSPFSTYEALAELAAKQQADLSHVVIVMMDDYVFPDGASFKHCPADAHYSCRRFGREEIWRRLNAGLPESKRIPESSLWFPKASDPLEYEARLASTGGIDLFILASGGSDGHVAFNPPGSAIDSETRVIELAETTRRDNLGTFPDFKGLDEVPKHGVSVGVGTILKHSKDAVLVIHGAHKQLAVKTLMKMSDFQSEWPVSLIYRCPGKRIYVDKSAYSGD